VTVILLAIVISSFLNEPFGVDCVKNEKFPWHWQALVYLDAA
jgi:hypothetical protein